MQNITNNVKCGKMYLYAKNDEKKLCQASDLFDRIKRKNSAHTHYYLTMTKS